MHSRKPALAAVLALACTANAGAQSIEQKVKARNDGVVELIFASKPGVCGDGRTFISTGTDDEGRHSTFTQSNSGFSTTTGSTNYRSRECDQGPVRVELRVRNGEVVEVDTYVGGTTIPAANTSARAATDYLLTLAETAGSSNIAKHALLPALLADVDVSARLLQVGSNSRANREVRKSAIFWLGQSGAPIAPNGLKQLVRDNDDEVAKSATFAVAQLRSDEGARILLEAARDDGLSSEVRKSAIFWLGQAAGEKATAGLKDLLSDEDSEVKKSAVFALSQIKSEQSVDALLDVVKNSKDREVRKRALFWLSQSKDPRVLALFEDILLK